MSICKDVYELPLFPSWSEALVFLTDQGRAAIAEHATPEAKTESKPAAKKKPGRKSDPATSVKKKVPPGTYQRR